MNLESQKPKTKIPVPQDDFDFDFKPITSGLGFHHAKQEIKPAPVEKSMSVPLQSIKPLKPDMQVYQNDLALFYGQEKKNEEVIPELAIEKTYRAADKGHRIFAYIMDVSFVASVVSIVLMFMARAIGMELLEAWSLYPNEITPLVATLFCGFYVIYFSIFEKSSSSTMGKYFLGMRVVNLENKDASFASLVIRSVVTLLNFATLGLFSYFDLQNKVTDTKVIRND